MKSARKATHKKLSDDYAKSALLALKAIQRGDPHTQEAIDVADVARTTDAERAMTKALNGVYLLKLDYNQKLELEQVLTDSSGAGAAAKRAALEPKIQTFSEKLGACFAEFEATLRARSTALPTACALDLDQFR